MPASKKTPFRAPAAPAETAVEQKGLPAMARTAGLAQARAQWLSESLAQRAHEAVVTGDSAELQALLARGFDPSHAVLFHAPLDLRSAPGVVESSLLGLALTMGDMGRAAARVLLEAGASPNASVFPAGGHKSPFPVSRFCFLLDDPDGLALLAEFGAKPEGFDYLAPPPKIEVAKDSWNDSGTEMKRTGEPARWRRLPQSHWGAESLRALAPRCVRWVQDKMEEGYAASFAKLGAPPTLAFNLTEAQGLAIVERKKKQQELIEKIDGRHYFGSRRNFETPKAAGRSCPIAYFYEGVKEQIGDAHERGHGGAALCSEDAASRIQAALGRAWPSGLKFWSVEQEEADELLQADFRAWAVGQAEREYSSQVSCGEGPAGWEPAQREEQESSRRQGRAELALCELAEIMARAVLCAELAAQSDPDNLATARGASGLGRSWSIERAEVFCAALFAQFAPQIGREKAQSWLDYILSQNKNRSGSEMSQEKAQALSEQFPALVEALDLARTMGPVKKSTRRPRAM